jgi:hypothetical protein
MYIYYIIIIFIVNYYIFTNFFRKNIGELCLFIIAPSLWNIILLVISCTNVIVEVTTVLFLTSMDEIK